ncbi:MAG: Ig-like domain-containing protein [Candidatus Limnocylindrales bacterium]
MAFALLVLAGGAIVFAGGGLNSAGPKPGSSTSGAPLPAPQILTPEVTLTRSTAVDLTLVRPSGLDPAVTYTVRITVNATIVNERPMPQQEQFVVAGVPLSEGENSVRAALLDGTELGATSAPLTITRDTTAPVIRVTRPEPGSTVYGEQATLRGRTEAGATINVSDVATGAAIEASVDAEGRFTADLTLALGDNQLQLASRDPAGNEASARITITRASSLAVLTLTVSDDQLKVADLPQQLEVTASILDENGQPVDGAQVTFSLSPPNATTLTYRSLSVAGKASWPDLEIASADDPRGSWLVTVLAVLPSGTELRANKSLSVR